MIYVLGFQQDIVISYILQAMHKGQVPTASLRVVPMEDVQNVELDPDHLVIRRIDLVTAVLTLKETDVVYLRPYAFDEAAKLGLAESASLLRWRSCYQNLMLGRQTKLGNTALRSESNNSKILHARGYSDILSTAPWRATNGALQFEEYREHIVKSPSHLRTHVVDSAKFLVEAGPEASVPVLVQKRFEGVPVRVTVVGFKDVIAAEVHSRGSIDYRYAADHDIRRIDLPDDVQWLCLRVALRYGVPLCGIDLIRDGEYWCFLEVNPEPGWAFLSPADNLDILRSVLSYLESHRADETLSPDESLHAGQALEAEAVSVGGAVGCYPETLRPTDYVARPGEMHPFWGTP